LSHFESFISGPKHLNVATKKKYKTFKKKMASLAKNFILIGALNTNYHTQAFGLMGFQRPATLIMEKIVDLHHDIFSVLLFLTILVVYLLTVNIFKYSATRIKTKRNFFFRSCAVLEIA